VARGELSPNINTHMIIRNQNPYQSSSSSSDGRIIGVGIASVIVTAAAVGFQMALQSIFNSVFGAIALSILGVSISTVFSAVFEGAATAALTYLLVGKSGNDVSSETRLRGWFSAILVGSVVAVSAAIAIENTLAIGGSGAGGPPVEFLPNVIGFAIVILCAGAVGGVMLAIVNRGLIAIGLSVVGELAKDGGERLAEKLAPDFVKDKWQRSYEQEKDKKSFALTKGLATATRWLVECKFCDSEAIVSGVVIGMTSGAAAYYLEILHGAENGFLGKVFVELVGSVVGILGGSMVLGLITAMFRYPLQLLGDFSGLGLIVGMIALLFKGCSML
jgi:hypothetical protein